jgi:hypothetical protein
VNGVDNISGTLQPSSHGNRLTPPQVSIDNALRGATVPTTLRIGLAVLLLLAVGCTTGDRQARPPSAGPATTTPASADPTTVPRRPLRLPTLTPGTPCPVARAHQVDPAFAEGPEPDAGLLLPAGGTARTVDSD